MKICSRLVCILIILTVLIHQQSNAQISQGGKPLAFSDSLKSVSEIPFVNMPYVNNMVMEASESYTWDKSGPFKFGKKTDVQFSIENSGEWQTLSSGDRIWNMGIRSKGAYSINLIFSEFKVPIGARVFIYNSDKTHFIGGFDFSNNKAHGKLATTLVRGDEIIIEYFEPKEVQGKGKLTIGSVTHAYKDVLTKNEDVFKGYGFADECTININCQQGDEWQTQSRSVVMLLVNESSTSGFCSGTLINNVNGDGTPFILTAEHCIGNRDISTTVSLFNYESPICSNAYPDVDNTISGAILRSKDEDSDFALLEMSSTPPASYNAVYSGWTRSDVSPTRYICIGHPSGDIKKWSEEVPKGSEPGYWWSSPKLNAGQTEYGSSGSGVWNQNGRLVGQLYGGSGWCNEIHKINYWGQFHESWTGNGADTSRLKNWLDPSGTDTLFVNHFDPNATDTPEITFQLNTNYINDLFDGGAVWITIEGQESKLVLTDIDEDGIYTLTTSFEPGTDIKYSYSYQNGSNPDTNIIEENDSLIGSECCDAEGYRLLTIEARNQTLTKVIFASCLAKPLIPEIKFQVDMNSVTNLYPNGSVWVGFGNWNSWKEMRDSDGDGIYSATIPMIAGTEWKYMYGYQTGADPEADYVDERSIMKSTECTNSNGHRLLQVPDANLILPPVMYGTCNEALSKNTLLSSLSVDGVNLSPEFNSNTYRYSVNVPQETSSITVNATPADSNAIISGAGEVSITPETKRVSVLVTAEDGTTKRTYFIRINVATSIYFHKNYQTEIAYNSKNDILKISNSIDIERIEIFSLTGQCILSIKSNNQPSIEISTNKLYGGVYVVRIRNGSNEIQGAKFIK